jgi:hypothetical protein
MKAIPRYRLRPSEFAGLAASLGGQITDTAPSAKKPAPAIYALTIERFRGLTSLKWKPSRGVNVILGGGDVGKTTIPEAIALLFSPVNPTMLSPIRLSRPRYRSRVLHRGCSVPARRRRNEQPDETLLALGMDR